MSAPTWDPPPWWRRPIAPTTLTAAQLGTSLVSPRPLLVRWLSAFRWRRAA